MRTTWPIPAVSLALLLGGCESGNCEGILTLASEEDVEAGLHCTHVTALAIEGSQLSRLSLPNLVTVERDVGISNNATLMEISLPALESAGGFMRVSGNTLLTSLSLPKVAKLGGLELLNDPALTSLDFSSLSETTEGGVTISRMAAMTRAELPSLVNVGAAIEVGQNDELTSISFPKLEASGRLNFQDNSRLTDVSLPLLATASGNVSFVHNARLKAVALPALTSASGLFVTDHAALASFAAPALASVTTQVEFADNLALAALDLGALKNAECVWLHGNKALPDCEVKALEEQVTRTCGKVSDDNKGDGCP